MIGKAVNLSRRLVVLIILLLGLIAFYSLGPARSLYDTRSIAINRLYLVELTERVPWLDTFQDRVTTQVAPRRQIPAPDVTVASGFFSRPFNLEIRSNSKVGEVYFTLDGSIPTRRSRRYLEPITISKTTTLRTRVIVGGYMPGVITSETYFVGENLELPVMALTSDPAGLYDQYAGVFMNPFERGKAWHRPVVATYIPRARDRVIKFNAGIKIHGNYTRDLPKKSMRLFYSTDGLRSEELPAILRPNHGASEHQVVLRQGGDDYETRFRSMLFDSLYQELDGITSAYEPVFVFINGEPIGIYNIREYLDLNFLQRHFGSDEFDMVIDGSRAKAGDITAFSELVQFLGAHDLSVEENFDVAASMVDISNTLDYWLTNIYAASVDWPGRNTTIFRAKSESDEKWRWISWDKDVTFNKYDTELEHNTLAYAVRKTLRDDLLWYYSEFDQDIVVYLKGTLIIRSLLENSAFRSRFITRFLDLLNSHFQSDNVERHLRSIIKLSTADLARDWEIWSFDETKYEHEVEKIHSFARERPNILREQLRDLFDLGPSVTVRLAIEPQGSGTIAINSIRPETLPWEGEYFEGHTISLTADAASGYQFAGWGGPNFGAAKKIVGMLTGDAEFVAKFEPISQ